MGFSDEDRILMKNLYVFKGYGPKQHITEFPNKGWGLRGLNKLLIKLLEAGTMAIDEAVTL